MHSVWRGTMHLIDLHCDTLYRAVTENLNIDSEEMNLQIDFSKDRKTMQCFAIWLPDEYTSDMAEKTFLVSAKRIIDECNRLNIPLISKDDIISDFFNNNKYTACFTVENGKALNGKLENIKKFSELGVKIMTITWNGRNEIGDGAGVEKPKGITQFGKQVIDEMEKNNIIVDISHASENLFYDVAEISKRPFIATHSNSYNVTKHKRNLTDEQFKVLISQGGITGINFYKAFLNNNPDKATKFDILKHVEHFMALGGENNISIGSDFDGCELPKDIKGGSSMGEIYEMFLMHNYNEDIIRKIFYENALNFFENFDNQRIM